MPAKTGGRTLIWQLCITSLVILCILCLMRLQGEGSDWHPTDAAHSIESDCSTSASTLEQLHLGGPISYAQVQIDVKDPKRILGANHDTGSKELGINLPALRGLGDSGDTFCAKIHETSVNRTTLYMEGPPDSIDASKIVFGVATTLDRLEDSLLPFSLWAGNTGARILALVHGESGSAGRIATVLRDASDLGIKLDIARQELGPDATDGDHYFALTKHLYEHQPDTPPEWAAFIDDDTFFPSIEGLLDRLAQYNASASQYIGGLAEDLHQLQNFGYMAYGGGGVFLSIPLLARIYENFDVCNAQRWEGGDKRLAECIYTHTTTKLSWEPGLHQSDIHGDASGFYEADRELPLSLHHWKSWHEADVVSMSAVSAICGRACVLRRYAFTDGWYLANGFSLFKYSDEYEADDGVMEETWWDGGDYEHTLAPLHPKDHGKISYSLERSIVEAGTVRQYYVRRRDGGDGAVEVIWRRRP